MLTPKRAIIICSPDGFANGDKPRKMERFLREHDFEVTIHSTSKLTHLGTGKFTKMLPALGPKRALAHCYEVLLFLASGRGQTFAKNIAAFSLVHIIKLRGAILARQLAGAHYDLLICENNLDEGLFLHQRIAPMQVLDLATPQAEELYYGGSLTDSGLAKLQALEKKIYARADRLSFHWHTYSEFVKQHKYDGPNFFDLGYGSPTTELRAKFAAKPRIVFFGYLKGYWVNLPLLEKLCELYPDIDIYGGPPPTGPLAKHYKGYAPNKDVLAEYQFGLITITDDELRRHSFSSKHLDYISYGLPVLTPDWRHDSVLEPSSIYYTPENFLSQIEKFSAEKAWRAKNKAALKTADELAWSNVLAPLAELPIKPKEGDR